MPKSKPVNTKECSFVVKAYQRTDNKCKIQIFNGNGHDIRITIQKVAKKAVRAAALTAMIWLSFMAATANADDHEPTRSEVVVASQSQDARDEYDKLAIRAVLGEARSEGYDAMYAIACAIRNRKSLGGVYGLHVIQKIGDTLYAKNFRTGEFSEEISEELYQIASKAWYLSEEGPDAVHGATNWLSDYDLSHSTEWTSWIWAYVKTARYGTTNFYKFKS